MFGVFFHPRSAARQREVPELSVAAPVRADVNQMVLLQRPEAPAATSDEQEQENRTATPSAAIRLPDFV